MLRFRGRYHPESLCDLGEALLAGDFGEIRIERAPFQVLAGRRLEVLRGRA
jgi:hypothetical protein